jgi:hypothetical protein
MKTGVKIVVFVAHSFMTAPPVPVLPPLDVLDPPEPELPPDPVLPPLDVLEPPDPVLPPLDVLEPPDPVLPPLDVLEPPDPVLPPLDELEPPEPLLPPDEPLLPPLEELEPPEPPPEAPLCAQPNVTSNPRIRPLQTTCGFMLVGSSEVKSATECGSSNRWCPARRFR